MKRKLQDALRAKDNAEKLFAVKDFVGAKNYALEAYMLCPTLEGISQMVTTFDIYCAAERKFGREVDFYSVLGMEPSVDRSTLKKQYKKLAVLLHPDKNKSVGAEGAFKLVSEAWTLLSDHAKRKAYDLSRNKRLSCGVIQTNLSSPQSSHVTGFDNCSNSLSSHNRLDTFWTLCSFCHVQYEYLRKYVNKKLSCKNCRGVFIAVETRAPPVSASYPYSPWHHAPDNEHVSHRYNGAYIPTTAGCFTGKTVPEIQSGHGTGSAPNLSFQWGSSPGTSAAIVENSGLRDKSASYVHTNLNSNGHMKRRGRPPKKLKVDMHQTPQNNSEDMTLKTESVGKLNNGYGNVNHNFKIPTQGESLNKLSSPLPTFDARKLLIDKARTVIRKKLEEMREMRLSKKNEKAQSKVEFPGEAPSKATVLAGLDRQPERSALSGPITVPDSDFHDFDRDRTEECFDRKQIWALYDEEDGMPRLYCLIRQVISVKPFKVHISYLSSRTDNEFGSVNWLDSGFTKSCGSFRAFNTDIVDQVNIFSHHLTREKAGRGGCVKIYPKRGDIWAVYRNWSPDWNRNTPDNVRHQYEMVEVLDDYSEELGVRIAPLIKLDGFKTVYQRNTNNHALRWIPRREMVRFSHQVPSCALKGKSTDLPDGCWDLDPAATPEELLQLVTETQVEKPHELKNYAGRPAGIFQPEVDILVDENQNFQEDNINESPMKFLEKLNEVQLEITPNVVRQDSFEMKVQKTPVEVLQELSEVQLEKPYYMESSPATPTELLHPVSAEQVMENCFIHAENSAIPIEGLIQGATETQAEKPHETQELHEVQMEKPYYMELSPATPRELLHPVEQVKEKYLIRAEHSATPIEGLFQRISETQVENSHEMANFAATRVDLHTAVEEQTEAIPLFQVKNSAGIPRSFFEM